MSDERFSEDLKKAIEEGFVLIDERSRTATVGEGRELPRAPEAILLHGKRVMGLRSELAELGYTLK